MVRTLTLEDRRKIEMIWRRNASPVKIAAELGISQCTVYTELKRGQETDGAGGVVLDENFRPAYSAERGETVYNLWGKEYYSVASKKKERRAPCACCDNAGKVTIKGVEYDCPRCKGDWRGREVIGETTVYYVGKWTLKSISATLYDVALYFEQLNSTERSGSFLQVRSAYFHDMVYREYGRVVRFYDDYKAAMEEVKRLNAAEREKQKGAADNG